MQANNFRILLTGSKGQVGRALVHTLAPLGIVMQLDRDTLDLTDIDAIRRKIRESKPGLIINAAAYTAVDRAETDPDLAMTVNGIAPGIFAEEALRLNIPLVHYSTDYVFDGIKSEAYSETDIPNPLNVYGKTKLHGEKAIQAVGSKHYILRTSWVYAAEGANFLNTILRLARERSELRIVDDQIGAPTWAQAIAEMTTRLLLVTQNPDIPPRYGLYHLTAAGVVSWFGFAQTILAEGAEILDGKAPPEVLPIATHEYPLPARRPANSKLDTSLLYKTFGITPSSWQSMLANCIRQKIALHLKSRG